jgi:hypothetical protein
MTYLISSAFNSKSTEILAAGSSAVDDGRGGDDAVALGVDAGGCSSSWCFMVAGSTSSGGSLRGVEALEAARAAKELVVGVAAEPSTGRGAAWSVFGYGEEGEEEGDGRREWNKPSLKPIILSVWRPLSDDGWTLCCC